MLLKKKIRKRSKKEYSRLFQTKNLYTIKNAAAPEYYFTPRENEIVAGNRLIRNMYKDFVFDPFMSYLHIEVTFFALDDTYGYYLFQSCYT